MTDRDKGEVRRYELESGGFGMGDHMVKRDDGDWHLHEDCAADHDEVVAGKDAEIARLEARLESENGCLQLMRDIIKHELGIEEKHFDGVIDSVVKEVHTLRARVSELEELNGRIKDAIEAVGRCLDRGVSGEELLIEFSRAINGGDLAANLTPPIPSKG